MSAQLSPAGVATAERADTRTGLRWGRIAEATLIHATLIAFIALTVFPFIWAFATSLKTPDQLLVFPPRLIPSPLAPENYLRAWEKGMGQGFVNSLFVCTVSVVLTVTIGAMAAYSLGRLQWRGRGLFLLVIIVPMMVPGLVLLVPTYIIMSRLQLLDTYAVLILLYTVRSLPLSVWIMRGFFETLPRELEEAAYIDGASRLRVLYHVILPLSQPALVATALIVFHNSWDDFLVASTMTSRAAMRTVQVALYFNIGEYGIDWGALMAASIMALLPMLILFILLQRRFISGITHGAIKG
jgi:ABC-type glycerol-3-phosphate transport system permease component